MDAICEESRLSLSAQLSQFLSLFLADSPLSRFEPCHELIGGDEISWFFSGILESLLTSYLFKLRLRRPRSLLLAHQACTTMPPEDQVEISRSVPVVLSSTTRAKYSLPLWEARATEDGRVFYNDHTRAGMQMLRIWLLYNRAAHHQEK